MIKSGGNIERLFNFLKCGQTQVDIVRRSGSPLHHFHSTVFKEVHGKHHLITC